MSEATGYPGDEDYDEGNYADADSLLGQPIPAVKWPEIGTSVSGVVLAVATADQRDLDGKVKTFPNGDVRRQVILTLQTEEGTTDDDDGRRRLFIKGAMFKPFRAAIAAAGCQGPRQGDMVTVTYAADGEKTGQALNPPKLFTVDYKRP